MKTPIGVRLYNKKGRLELWVDCKEFGKSVHHDRATIWRWIRAKIIPAIELPPIRMPRTAAERRAARRSVICIVPWVRSLRLYREARKRGLIRERRKRPSQQLLRTKKR